jgi:UDP-glucuronate decarboxylase
MLELAEEVLTLTKSESRRVIQLLPSVDRKQRQPNIAQARAKLGWEPRVQLADGLRETIANVRTLLTSV